MMRRDNDNPELRSRAEDKLKDSRQGNRQPRSVIETERLLHELQVHQIELEMQNEELTSSRVHLEELTDRYSDFYDFSPASFVSLDISGKIIQTNFAGSNLLDENRSELTGRAFEPFVLRTSRPDFEVFLQKTFSTGIKQTCEIDLAPDNKPPLTVQIEAALASNQQELRMVIMDLTASKKAAEDLRVAKLNAEDANRVKDNFLANMSHELRTPLVGIIGFSELLEKTPLTDHQAECLASISSSSDNLMMLVDNILDSIKAGAEGIELNLSRFNIQTTLSQIVATQKQKITSNGLSFQVDIPSDLPRLLIGDSIRIKQILLNLFDNAIKFTEKGTITFAISVVEQSGSKVILEFFVKDTGCGIAKSKQESIYEQFVQGEETINRRFGGSGLGLSICQSLAKLMDGNIFLESREGSGSTFSLRLPLLIDT